MREVKQLVTGPKFYPEYVVFHCFTKEIIAALSLNVVTQGMSVERGGKRAWDRN